MGQIIRLNTVFSNRNLPAIVDRDVSALEATILKHPNLQGFWDFGDKSTLTLSSNKITKILDKSANANPLIAISDVAPTLDNLTLKGISSGYFAGSQYLVSENTAYKSTWAEMTMVVFALKPEATSSPAATILASRKTTSSYALYMDNGSVSLNAGRAKFLVDTVVGKPLNIIASTVFETNESILRTPENLATGVRANLKAEDDYLYLGRWYDGADESHAAPWKGYIGHIMMFDKNLEKDPIFMDLLFEYARRKYATPLWG